MMLAGAASAWADSPQPLFSYRAERYWFQANCYHGDGKTLGQSYICAPKPIVIFIRRKVVPVI